MSEHVHPLLAVFMALIALWLGYRRAQLVVNDVRDGTYRHAHSGNLIASREENPTAFWIGVSSRLVVIAICAAVLAMLAFGFLL